MTIRYTYYLIGIFAGVLLAFAMAGCRANRPEMPTTQPAVLSARVAIGHSEAARELIIDARRDATKRSEPILIEAVRRTDAAIAAERQVIDEVAAFQQFVDASFDTISKLEAKLADVTADRDKIQRHHDESWFGGMFWRWFRIITGAGVALTLLGLFLNAKTDWFVYVWNGAIGVVAGAFKAVATVFGSIFGLFEKAKGPTGGQQ